MEGPTPVSALIHAATMVTAGVFMIAKCSPLFEYLPTALIVITFAGAMTSFLVATTGILQNDRKRGIGHARNISCLDSEGVSSHHSRGPKSGSGFSNGHMQCNNISCPVSPMGSPLLHSRSPQHTNGRMSPSPMSNPHAISGSSMPLTGAVGAIPFYHQIQKQPTTAYLHEGIIVKQSRSPNSFYPSSGTPYQDLKPDIFRAMPQGSHFPSENGFLGNNQFGRPKETYNGQSVLADRVSQQLLKDHMKLNPSIDLNPSSPLLGRKNEV